MFAEVIISYEEKEHSLTWQPGSPPTGHRASDEYILQKRLYWRLEVGGMQSRSVRYSMVDACWSETTAIAERSPKAVSLGQGLLQVITLHCVVCHSSIPLDDQRLLGTVELCKRGEKTWGHCEEA